MNKMFEYLQDAHDEITERQEKFETLFNNITDAIGLLRIKGDKAEFLEVNDALVGRTFLNREQIIRSDPSVFNSVPPKMIAEFARQLRQYGHLTIESAQVLCNEKVKMTELAMHLFEFRKQEVVLLISRDITESKHAEQERRKLQEQLNRSNKLSAIGQLAGGAAHELNNPLTAVLGISQILIEESEPGSRLHKDVTTIEEAALRCKRIVENMLLFARQNNISNIRTNLNELIERTLELSGNQLAMGKVEVLKDFTAGMPEINADVYNLQQVFLNIIINAQHAMPQGGVLTISTGISEGTVRAEFRDTGTGISAENLEKVFDPFFTTKETGKGTGLGLSVSYGIIEKLGGKITAESEGEGKGAAFIIELPMASGNVTV